MTNTPKRPANVIGNAVRVAQIATGELEEVVNLWLQGVSIVGQQSVERATRSEEEVRQ
jgi:hypothetical protein